MVLKRGVFVKETGVLECRGLVRKRQGIQVRGRKRERVEGLGSDPHRSGRGSGKEGVLEGGHLVREAVLS